MAEPRYVESLRGEIAELDQKIDDFNEKFDQRVDRLSENLHKVEIALEKVSTKLEDFIPRVDKFIDRVWSFFVTGLVLLLGSMATVGGSIGVSIWQAQQHGKQIDKLETSVTRLDKSVTSLEKSLEQHGQQLERLEKSAEKIVGLESQLTGREPRILVPTNARLLRLPLTDAHLKAPSESDPLEWVCEWELDRQQAVGIEPGPWATAILPITDPQLRSKRIFSAAEVFAGPRGLAIRLRLRFPDTETKKRAREQLLNRGLNVEVVIATQSGI